MKKLLSLLFISILVFLVVAVSTASAASLPFTAMGTVLDRHGSPVEGATVTLYDGNYFIIGTAVSDTMGNFGFTNVVASSPGCKATVSFKDGSKTYEIKFADTVWYPTDTGIVKFDTKYTTLNNYPAPEYGYVWGIMQQDGSSNSKALGNGVVYVASGDYKYYSYTDANKGTFIMRVPVGHYRLWGQYSQNGMIFQSSVKDIDVAGSTNYMDVNNVVVAVPLSGPANNPQPPEMPVNNQVNVVSGYVTYKDGKGIPNQVVTLYQATDDSGSYVKKKEATTDNTGFYQFYDVQVTTDAPENSVVFGSKSFNMTMTFTDPQGQTYSDSRKFTLYNPNFLTQDTSADNRARNPVINFSVGYSTLGWVKISSDTPNVKLYIDDKQVLDSAGQAVTMPYTAYLAPNRHYIKISSSGYDDRTIPVDIKENMQTTDVFVHLDKSTFPPWVPVAVALIILIIVALVILVLIFSRRQMILGMFGGVLSPVHGALGKSLGNFKASSQAKKAHKAQMAEVRKAEQARMAAQMREASIASQHKLDGKKKEQEKAFAARGEQPRLPEYRGGEEGEGHSIVMAHDIYKKQDRSGVERISSSQTAVRNPQPQGYEPKDTPRESKPVAATPDNEGRIRVPKSMPVARDQPPATNMRDKEKVIKYIREHSDGVSFIQMSNDLEIPPNTLTIITKELVINDDIEKIKGLYYYKSHNSSSDDSSSSVVVWRLDGEE